MKVNMFKFISLVYPISSLNVVEGQLITELVADYFSNWKISTVVWITCSTEDELKWLRHVSARNLSFYSGRGGLSDKCELHEDALKFTYRKVGVFVDYDCRCARRAIMEVDRYNFTTETIAWLFWSVEINSNQLKSLQLRLQFYSEVKFALQDGENVKLHDVYRVHPDTAATASPVGSWNVTDGFVWDFEYSKYERRLNFQKATLKAGLVVLFYNKSDPDLFEILRDYNRDKGQDAVTRSNLYLWDLLQEIHDFRLNTTVSNNFGYTKKEDGTYDGLVGDLQTEKVDVSLSGMGMLSWRLDLVDFNSVPVWPFRTCFFFFQPRILERSTLLINPFRKEVWLASFLIMMVASIFIYVIAAYDNSLNLSTGSVFLYISAIYSQQGAVLTSHWVSGRFLLLTSLIFGFFLFNYYSGQVVSELLAPTPSTITTTKQLLDSSLLLATDTSPPFLKIRHKTQKSQNIPEIGVKVEGTGGYLSLEEGIQKVRSSFYAFETEDSRGYRVIDKTYSHAEICSIGQISLPLIESFLTLKHHSPYKETFSISVMIIKERGILQRIVRLLRHSKPQCTGHVNIFPVDLENASVAFYVLLLGATAGCFVFFIEILSKPVRARKIRYSTRSILSPD